MRDSFRSVFEDVMTESKSASAWAVELANALICYAILHPKYAIPERDVSARHIRDLLIQKTGEFFNVCNPGDCAAHNAKFQATQAALKSQDPQERDTYARAVLELYLQNRGIPVDTAPNIHLSHLDVVGEYLQGIYNIPDESLVRYRFFRDEYPFGCVGQVTVFGTGDGYVMQGILVCPFFSTFQKTLPEAQRVRVADVLSKHANRFGDIRPTVVPIISNPVWRRRLMAADAAKQITLVGDEDIYASSECVYATRARFAGSTTS